MKVADKGKRDSQSSHPGGRVDVSGTKGNARPVIKFVSNASGATW